MKLKFSLVPGLLVAALGVAGPAMAGVTDVAGDVVSAGADYDVVSSFVSYNPSTDMFTISGTMAGNIVSSSGGRYVWGFNRGSATNHPFAGLDNVIFDTTVALNANGTGTIGSTALTVLVSGATISATFAASLLPTTTAGFGAAAYTWNLWPRLGTTNTDFAPDNAMAAVDVVPEPATWAMMGLGLAGLVVVSRRRRQR